jgi:hypothetical protein
MRRRLGLVALALVSILALAAGCSKSPPESTPSPPPSPPAANEHDKDAEGAAPDAAGDGRTVDQNAAAPAPVLVGGGVHGGVGGGVVAGYIGGSFPLAMRVHSTPKPTIASTTNSDEWLTVKLRYKRPLEDASVPFDVPVKERATERMVGSLGFAASVAAFGMLLRESEHRGAASFAMVAQLAREHRGADAHGHRAEFIRLVDIAQRLDMVTTAGR